MLRTSRAAPVGARTRIYTCCRSTVEDSESIPPALRLKRPPFAKLSLRTLSSSLTNQQVRQPLDSLPFRRQSQNSHRRRRAPQRARRFRRRSRSAALSVLLRSYRAALSSLRPFPPRFPFVSHRSLRFSHCVLLLRRNCVDHRFHCVLLTASYYVLPVPRRAPTRPRRAPAALLSRLRF